MKDDKRVILMPVVVDVSPKGQVWGIEGPSMEVATQLLGQDLRSIRLAMEAAEQKLAARRKR